jgi:RNA ligase
VVRYGKPALTLLTLRHRKTGAYNRALARDLSHRHRQPMAPLLADGLSSEEEVRARLLELREREDIEGGVLTWPNGRRLKVKTHTYLTRHKVLSDLANEREVYRCFLEGAVDDAASALGGARGRALSDFVMDLHSRLEDVAEEVRTFTDSISSLDRQDAVKEIKSRYSGSLQAAAFAAWNGENPEQRLRDLLCRRLEHAGKRNSLKRELGLPDWTIDLQALR